MIKTVFGQADKFLEEVKNKDFHFSLVLGGTKTIFHEGISAAGASQELLPYTAALDAEYLEYAEVKSLTNVPVSPAGIVSPVLISRACLELTNSPFTIINSGSHKKPQIDFPKHIDLDIEPAESVETGSSISLERVESLFTKGQEIAGDLLKLDKDFYLIGECVVGGTTTALGVLRALGYKCEGLISSSLPEGNHDLKNRLIEKGLNNATKNLKQDPLIAISSLGDTMQPVVLGMIFKLLKSDKKVLLAGGTQMMVIAKLFEIFSERINGFDKNLLSDSLAIATTPWVINDESASVIKLAEEINLKSPLLSFELEPEIEKNNPIFKSYSQGHVKEGVGAGGLLVSTLMRNTISQKDINQRLLSLFENLLSRA